jgi:hypothetical protein
VRNKKTRAEPSEAVIRIDQVFVSPLVQSHGRNLRSRKQDGKRDSGDGGFAEPPNK